MGRAGSTYGEKRNTYRILMGNVEGRRPLGRPKRRRKDSVEIDLREREWDGMDWIDLTQSMEQWRALVKLRVHKMVVNS
jgi:hypothetical protein